jgi:hypothetical protein
MFLHNSASIQGGSISYNYYKPIITNTSFSNNIAMYGNDLASFGFNIKLIKSD